MSYDTPDNVNKMFSALSAGQSIRDNVSTTALSSGMSLMQKKKYKEAAAAFKQAAALKPDSVDAYNMLATAYTQLGKKKEAIEAYKLSLKVNRNQEQVHINLANAYIDQKQYSDAEKSLKAAKIVNNTSVLATYTLGHLYAKTGRLEESEAEFRKVVKLVPKDANGRYGLGMILNKEGRYEEAVRELVQATKLKRDFAPAIYELGDAYASLGKVDEASAQLALLKKINTPQSIVSANTLENKLIHPKIESYNESKSTLPLSMGPFGGMDRLYLSVANPDFAAVGTRKEVSVQFQFDTEMDISSVTNIVNWRIRKSRGGTAGLYDNGMYRATDVSVPFMPERVTYDPVKKVANVIFTLSQNAAGDATIDPRHLVFKFSGVDSKGRSMDPKADEYSGWTADPF